MPAESSEYFDLLLRELRQGALSWLAEEIQAEIDAGRTVEKPIEGKRSDRGLTIAEFTVDEQLAIAMRVVLERAQVGHAVWKETASVLTRRLGVKAVEYVDVEGEDPPSTYEFAHGFGAAADDLARVFGIVASECGLHGTADVRRLSARPSSLRWEVE